MGQNIVNPLRSSRTPVSIFLNTISPCHIVRVAVSQYHLSSSLVGCHLLLLQTQNGATIVVVAMILARHREVTLSVRHQHRDLPLHSHVTQCRSTPRIQSCLPTRGW